MQQSIVKNLCRSPFDPKILNEVYPIYNYFKFEAGMQYTLEEVYVALTVPGITLMPIIFVDFLEVCYGDNLIYYKFAKNRAIRRFQLLLSWRYLFKKFFERLEVQIDRNIESLLVSNKLDPIELRELFYHFVKNIKLPTSCAKTKTILYQLSYDIVSQNKEHKGTLRETKYYEKQVKNKKNVLKLFQWDKALGEDMIFDDLGSIADDQFDIILEFGCSQVKKVFEDEANKIVVFKNRSIPNILFYRQDNRLYDLQGKEISELESKMNMYFNVESHPRKSDFESTQTHLLQMDPYDMSTQVLDEFYLILGDLKVLTVDDLIQNTRRIWLQLLHELNEYASTTHFRYDSDQSDQFEEEIKNVENIENPIKMIKSFIILVKSFKGKDKKEVIIPVKNLLSLPGLYGSMLVEQKDYLIMLTLYDEVLRDIFKARNEKKTTQSRQEVLDSKNMQMAKLSKMEKELQQKKRLRPLEYDSTEEQKHYEGVDSQVE